MPHRRGDRSAACIDRGAHFTDRANREYPPVTNEAEFRQAMKELSFLFTAAPLRIDKGGTAGPG